MGRAGRLRCALLVPLLVGGAAAHAAPVDDAVPVERQAREHYDRALLRYEAGDYDAAVGAFIEAYQLRPSPRLLFDIAQAYRLKQEFPQSVFFYTAYLRDLPDATNRAEVERRIVEIGGRPPELRAPPVDRKRPREGTIELATGLAVAGAGLALIGAAIYCNVDAITIGNELSSVAAPRPDLAERRESDLIAAGVLYGLGGATLVSGVVLTAVGARRLPLRVALAPAAGGALVAAAGRW
jgi:hypothetical protein